MQIVMFYHSLLSDWNHGNAHFLRGIATELTLRGHEVTTYEPRDAWSMKNLIEQHGTGPVKAFLEKYPLLKSRRYHPGSLDLDQILENADMVIVHEWNDHALVRRIGECRASRPNCRLYFHDTHHRMVTQPGSMARYDLSNYDGVLAYGRVLQQLYETTGLTRRAWTWHEAADTRIFQPIEDETSEGDLVWVGNWGDDERASELQEFLFAPSSELGLKSRVYGVRYPENAQAALRNAGINYAGWLPNFEAPSVFARHRMTVHVPRRPYVEALPGIPTIRPFEALACGIPLVCSPWEDCEHLFRPGKDYLVARSGAEMRTHLRDLKHDPSLRAELARNGLQTIRARHTCSHRVHELLEIDRQLRRSEQAVDETAPLALKA